MRSTPRTRSPPARSPAAPRPRRWTRCCAPPGTRSRQRRNGSSSAARARGRRGRARCAQAQVAVALRQQVERVEAQAAAQRLQRDHVLGADVAEVRRSARPGAAATPAASAAAPRRSRVSLPERAPGSRRRARRGRLPSASNSPTVPLSRPSAITIAAPAARSLSISAHQSLATASAALAADLGDHGELAGELRDQLGLARARQRQRAVGDLDVIDPQLVQPLDVALQPSLVDGDLQQRPAGADGDAGVAADRDLVGHGAADVRGAPARA